MQLTSQEIFDRVATHLLTQKKKAMSANGDCVYRAADGSKCAVGCLMPDAVYSPAYEGRGAQQLPLGVLRAIGIPNPGNGFGAELKLLHALQAVHDDEAVRHWDLRLVHVAKRFGLEWGTHPGLRGSSC